MKKTIYFIVIIITSIASIQGKHYKYLSRLGNITSRKCANIRPAIFYRGHDEYHADLLEETLEKIAQGKVNSFRAEPEFVRVKDGWEIITTTEEEKAAICMILIDENYDIKDKECREFNTLAQKISYQFYLDNKKK